MLGAKNIAHAAPTNQSLQAVTASDHVTALEQATGLAPGSESNGILI
jgi:hypothetical protein